MFGRILPLLNKLNKLKVPRLKQVAGLQYLVGPDGTKYAAIPVDASGNLLANIVPRKDILANLISLTSGGVGEIASATDDVNIVKLNGAGAAVVFSPADNVYINSTATTQSVPGTYDVYIATQPFGNFTIGQGKLRQRIRVYIRSSADPMWNIYVKEWNGTIWIQIQTYTEWDTHAGVIDNIVGNSLSSQADMPVVSIGNNNTAGVNARGAVLIGEGRIANSAGEIVLGVSGVDGTTGRMGVAANTTDATPKVLTLPGAATHGGAPDATNLPFIQGIGEIDIQVIGYDTTTWECLSIRRRLSTVIDAATFGQSIVNIATIGTDTITKAGLTAANVAFSFDPVNTNLLRVTVTGHATDAMHWAALLDVRAMY